MDLFDRYGHLDDPVGEEITHMSTKRYREFLRQKIVNLGLVDSKTQLYKKRGDKARRKSNPGHDSEDKELGECQLCNIKFTHSRQKQEHLNGKKHGQKVKSSDDKGNNTKQTTKSKQTNKTKDNTNEGSNLECTNSIPPEPAETIPPEPTETVQAPQVSSTGAEIISQSHGLGGFGHWEAHTRGIGSKLMMKMGYVPGKGLGKHGAGRVHSVPIHLLPKGKSLDKIMKMKEKSGEPDMFDVLKKREKKRKRKKEKEKEFGECKLCKIKFTNSRQKQEHLKGKKHGQKVKSIASVGDTEKSSEDKKDDTKQTNKSKQTNKTKDNTSEDLGECKLCQVVFASSRQKQQHVLGKKHQKKMKVLASVGVTEESSEDKTNNTKQTNKTKDNTNKDSGECKLCQVVFASSKEKEQHLKGMKHERKVKLLASCWVFEKSLVDNTSKASKDECSRPTPQICQDSKSMSTGIVPVRTINKLRGQSQNEEQVIINCKGCQKIFYDRDCVGEHIKSKEHKNNVTHQQNTNRKNISDTGGICELCGASFSNTMQHKQHLQGIKHIQMEQWSADGRLIDIAMLDKTSAQTNTGVIVHAKDEPSALLSDRETSMSTSASIPSLYLRDNQNSNRKETLTVNGKNGLRADIMNISPIPNNGLGITIGKRKNEDVHDSSKKMKTCCNVSPMKHCVPTTEENSSIPTKEETSLSISSMKQSFQTQEENSLNVSPMTLRHTMEKKSFL